MRNIFHLYHWGIGLGGALASLPLPRLPNVHVILSASKCYLTFQIIQYWRVQLRPSTDKSPLPLWQSPWSWFYVPSCWCQSGTVVLRWVEQALAGRSLDRSSPLHIDWGRGHWAAVPPRDRVLEEVAVAVVAVGELVGEEQERSPPEEGKAAAHLPSFWNMKTQGIFTS